MDNTQDQRRLIKCLAPHDRVSFSYDDKGGVIHSAGVVCELCNGSGWAFRDDVVAWIDKRYEAEPPKSKLVEAPDKKQQAHDTIALCAFLGDEIIKRGYVTVQADSIYGEQLKKIAQQHHA